MATSYTFKPIVTDGLLFYLDACNTKSYIGSGTSSYDIKNNQLGELKNGVSFSNGIFTFDGVNDYIDFGTSLAQTMSGYDKFTVSIWVKKTSSVVDAPLGIYDGSPLKGWFLQWYSNGIIYCGVRNGGINSNSTSLDWTDSWYNITFVFDGAQANDIDKGLSHIV